MCEQLLDHNELFESLVANKFTAKDLGHSAGPKQVEQNILITQPQWGYLTHLRQLQTRTGNKDNGTEKISRGHQNNRTGHCTL